MLLKLRLLRRFATSAKVSSPELLAQDGLLKKKRSSETEAFGPYSSPYLVRF